MFRGALVLTTASSVVIAAAAPAARANDQDNAEALALSSVNVATDGDLAAFYQNKTTPAFKNAIRQDDFTQAMGVLRNKLGAPPRPRPLAQGSQKSALDPLNRRGDFYFVRIRANYMTGSLFWE